MKYTPKLLTLLLAAFVIGGCEVTDLSPESEIVPDNFYQTDEDANAAIAAAYNSILGYPNNLIMWGDARSDNTLRGNGAQPQFVEFTENNISPTNGFANWSGLYSGINRANLVIARIPGIQDPRVTELKKNQLVGEALFLRAWQYFLLTRNWGDVPLLLEPYVSLDQDFKPAKTAADQVVEQIITDLNEAKSRLNVTYNATSRRRAAKGTVYALLTHVYMWKRDYANAAAFADSLLNQPRVRGNYSLVTGANYGTLFNDQFATESIFEIDVFNTVGSLSNVTQTLLPNINVQPVAGSGRLAPSSRLVEAFEANDLRRTATLGLPGQNPDNFNTPANITFPYVRKYTGQVVGTQRSGNDNFIVLRLADIILLRAEALNELNRTTEAITLLDQIRTRAGLARTTARTQEAVRRAISQERLVELAFEGHRWYDLVRTNTVTEALAATSPTGTPYFPLRRNLPQRRLLPIANGELLLNTNLLPQNTQ